MLKGSAGAIQTPEWIASLQRWNKVEFNHGPRGRVKPRGELLRGFAEVFEDGFVVLAFYNPGFGGFDAIAQTEDEAVAVGP